MNKKHMAPVRGFRNLLLPVLLVVSGLVNVYRGQDNWWDVINYHIQNPWNLFHHRWTQDLFVSGIQGYFHPLADIPYYLLSMVWLPDHPMLVAFIAGFPYGFLVFVAYLITSRLAESIVGPGSTERRIVVAVVTGLAVTGVSAWSQAGTTTNGVTVSTLVLFALYLLIATSDNGSERMPLSRLFFMGGLLGLAAGLKLTSAIYAPAMGLVILFMNQDLKSAFRAGLSYGLGWFVVFAIIYGPWAWHLYSLTGNPMFPMFNNIFHSSYSAAVGGRDRHYFPKNTLQWLFYPFYWLNPDRPTVYNLLSFRDARILFFYVAAIVYFIHSAIKLTRHRIKASIASDMGVLVVFCSLSYVVWILMFSMLRYAIVIEVMASILGLLLFWAALTKLRMRFVATARVLLVAIVVSTIMVTTVYPDVGRVDFGKRVYTASVPKLDEHALVVFANQPMGLLAPLIHRVDKDAQFVGLPYCFKKRSWCYNGFYNYGLGNQLKSKIANHSGPIYVAYYLNRMSTMPQLALFRLVANTENCEHMTTNATADVALCRAHYIPPGKPLPPPASLRQKLELLTTYEVPGAHVEGVWQKNECTTRAGLSKLKFTWNIPTDLGKVHVYLIVPPSRKKVSFAAGGSQGSATTGRWVRAAQSFVFATESGKVIATVRTKYTKCE